MPGAAIYGKDPSVLTDSQLEAISATIKRMRYSAQLKYFLSNLFNRPGRLSLLKKSYPVAARQYFETGQYSHWSNIGSVAHSYNIIKECENSRRQLSSEDELDDTEMSVEQVIELTVALPVRPPNTTRLEHVRQHLTSTDFGKDQKFATNLLECLRLYYTLDGYCVVPCPHSGKSKLQTWAKGQRQAYLGTSNNPLSLPDWKRNILEEVNFVMNLNEYKFDVWVDKLDQFIQVNGRHAYPSPLGEERELYYFVYRLKNGEYTLNESRRTKLRNIGWDPNAPHLREFNAQQKDAEMVQKLQEFHARTGHTNVPHSLSGHGDRELWDLYTWKTEACKRYQMTVESDEEPDGFLPLAEEVINQMNVMGVILNPIGHFGVNRIENRHYEKLPEVYEKKYRRKLEFNARDKSIVKDPFYPDGTVRPPNNARRPDAVLYHQKRVTLSTGETSTLTSGNVASGSSANNNKKKSSKGKKKGAKKGAKKIRQECRKAAAALGMKKRTIIDEFDERRHDGESIESEQRKVYHQVTTLLKQDDCGDVHLIRTNGADRYFASEIQLDKHAEILHTIKQLPMPVEPTVTVWMLDWDHNHHHVKAYQRRILNGCERATLEEEWDTRPLYEQVHMYSSGEAK